MSEFYLIGSLRNEQIPVTAGKLRAAGINVFDSWYAAGPIADDSWQAYEKNRGLTYPQALEDYAAKHVFEFDRYHLDRCDGAILSLPAGKSGHLELGYMVGRGKRCYVLFDKEPDRWDVMYQFANLNGGGVFYSVEELIDAVRRV